MQFLEIFITWNGFFQSQFFKRKYEAKTRILRRLKKFSNQNNFHGRGTTGVGRAIDIFLNNALFLKNSF